MTERVEWRGQWFDKRTADMLEELARISGNIYINPTQGSYNTSVSASGNTHSGGGAGDLMHPSWSIADFNTVAKLARKIGFFAAHRTPQQANWPRHCHLIAVQPWGMHDKGVLSTAAHQQVIDYMNNRNGLASHARDDGPRDWVGEIWEHYKNPHPTVDLANLRYGKENSDVKDMQRALHFHHMYVLCDGIYGPATDDAVRKHQRDRGLGSDAARHSFIGPAQAKDLGLVVG